MLEAKQQSRSPVQLDPATHAECLEFVRAAISEADHAEIWAALSETEQQQFQELLGPPPIVPMVHWNVGDRV